ncbi:hypothetical protein HID58_076161, partial [Brassica napus]
GFFWPLLCRLSPIALSELWIGTILQRWFPRVEGRRGRVEANGMEAIIDPSSPVCFQGGGGFFSFAVAGSSSREGEAFSAPSSPVLAPEGWLFGFEGMSDR